MKIRRVIFVCQDNTCLGPAAESIFNRISADYGIEAISRGMVVLFPEPLNTKMLTVMNEHGLEPMSEQSRQLTAEDLTTETLILAMSDADVDMVTESFPEANVKRLRDFVGQKGNVEAPIGGSLDDYERCFEYLDLLTKMAAQVIFKEDIK